MISDEQYVALSEFRFRLSQFLHFSEATARELGVSTAQYQLMLHVRAAGADGFATIGDLAKRLSTTHQAAVALVQRCQARQLVTKRRSTDDERRVEVRLAPAARKLLQKLAERHIAALHRIHDVIRISHLTDLSKSGDAAGRRRESANALKTGPGPAAQRSRRRRGP